MKFQMLRFQLLLIGGLLLIAGLLGWGVKDPDRAAAYSPPKAGDAVPLANVHLWDINELFICGDGSGQQFIELRTTAPNEIEIGEEQIIVTNSAGQSRTFTFPDGDLVGPTTNKSLLIATAGFGSVPGGVTPDFILPANFLFPEGGTVRFGAEAVYDSVSYGALPTNGVNSLNRQGASMVSGVNSPKNYAGQQGSASCPPAPPAPNLTLSKIADSATGIVQPGGVLSYTITVLNSGSAAATGALITDTVPVSTTYVPNSASNGGIFGSGVISWTNLTINPATSLTRTLLVTVSATVTAGNKITNTAYITSAEGVKAIGSYVVTVGEATVRKTYLPIIRKNG